MSHRPPEEAPAVRIEADNEWAWCGERRLELTPRAFAVLRHLVEHPQRLITKDDLLTTVWRDAIVSDAALASNRWAWPSRLPSNSPRILMARSGSSPVSRSLSNPVATPRIVAWKVPCRVFS